MTDLGMSTRPCLPTAEPDLLSAAFLAQPEAAAGLPIGHATTWLMHLLGATSLFRRFARS